MQEIESKLENLSNELKNVRGKTTEVYTRIVGYYRSVKNWNRGKREEYNHRMTYGLPVEVPKITVRPESRTSSSEKPQAASSCGIAMYQYFYRTTCPNCPPVKSYLADLGFSGSDINVDMQEGYNLAGDLAVCATPTVIFRDSRGNEIFRASNLHDLMRSFEAEQAAV